MRIRNYSDNFMVMFSYLTESSSWKIAVYILHIIMHYYSQKLQWQLVTTHQQWLVFQLCWGSFCLVWHWLCVSSSYPLWKENSMKAVTKPQYKVCMQHLQCIYLPSKKESICYYSQVFLLTKICSVYGYLSPLIKNFSCIAPQELNFIK